MADANVNAVPMMPLAWLDGLSRLNNQLEVYHALISALSAQMMVEGPPMNVQTFICGIDDIFKPVLEGYRDIENQASDLLKAHQRLKF